KTKSSLKNKKEPKTLDTQRFLALLQLLPLYRCRWFRGNIIYNPIHLVDFLGDSFADLVQYIIINSCPIRCHPINGMHRTNTEHIIMSMCVITHSDNSNIRQHCNALPKITIHSYYCNLSTQNSISITDDG